MSDSEGDEEQEFSPQRGLFEVRMFSIRAVATIYSGVKCIFKGAMALGESIPEQTVYIQAGREQVLKEKRSLSGRLSEILRNRDVSEEVTIADSLLERIRQFDVQGYADLIQTAEDRIGHRVPRGGSSPTTVIDQLTHQLQRICDSCAAEVKMEGEATEGLEYLNEEAGNLEELVADIQQCDETLLHEHHLHYDPPYWTPVSVRDFPELEVKDQAGRLSSRPGRQSCFFVAIGTALEPFGYTALSYWAQTQTELARTDTDMAVDYERYRIQVAGDYRVPLQLLVYSGLPEHVALAVFRSPNDGIVSLTVFTCGQPLYVVCAYIAGQHIMSARFDKGKEPMRRWTQFYPYFSQWCNTSGNRGSVILTTRNIPCRRELSFGKEPRKRVTAQGRSEDLQLELGGRDNGSSQLEEIEKGAMADVNRSELVLSDEPEPVPLLNHLDDEHEQHPRSVMATNGRFRSIPATHKILSADRQSYGSKEGSGSGIGSGSVGNDSSLPPSENENTRAQQYVEDYVAIDLADLKASGCVFDANFTEKFGKLVAGIIFSDGSMVIYPPCSGDDAVVRHMELNSLEDRLPLEDEFSLPTRVVYASSEEELISFLVEECSPLEGEPQLLHVHVWSMLLLNKNSFPSWTNHRMPRRSCILRHPHTTDQEPGRARTPATGIGIGSGQNVWCETSRPFCLRGKVSRPRQLSHPHPVRAVAQWKDGFGVQPGCYVWVNLEGGWVSTTSYQIWRTLNCV